MVAAADPVWSFWLGFSLLIAFLQIWHLALPINEWTLLAPLALGAGGLLWNASDLRRCWSALPVSDRVILTLAFGGLATWLADRAWAPFELYDTGLYHISVVRWAQAHPIVPGLVNLHYRLAFNNASLLYVAALDHWWWRGWALQISGGALVLMLGLMVTRGLVRWANGSGPATTAIVRLLLIMPITDIAMLPTFSSTSTDIPVIALTLVAGLACLALLDSRDDEDSPPVVFLSLCAVCAAATCVKLSALVFSACAGLLGGLIWLRAADIRMVQRLGVAALGVAVAVLLLAPWMARGVVLSGYPLYPSTVGAAPVEWRAPEAATVAMRVETRDWARWEKRPPKDSSGWEWLGTWVENRMPPTRSFWQALPPALLVTAATLALVLRAWRAPADLWRARPAARLLLPTTLALAFWWYAAPNPRFGAQVIWLFAALIGALAVLAWRLDQTRRTRAAVLVCCLVYGTLPITLGNWGFWRSLDREFGPQAPPTVELQKFVTASGLSLWTPAKLDQCWDAPIPCTPYPDHRLRLRQLPHLHGGFVLADENRKPGRKAAARKNKKPAR